MIICTVIITNALWDSEDLHSIVPLAGRKTCRVLYVQWKRVYASERPISDTVSPWSVVTGRVVAGRSMANGRTLLSIEPRVNLDRWAICVHGFDEHECRSSEWCRPLGINQLTDTIKLHFDHDKPLHSRSRSDRVHRNGLEIRAWYRPAWYRSSIDVSRGTQVWQIVNAGQWVTTTCK